MHFIIIIIIAAAAIVCLSFLSSLIRDLTVWTDIELFFGFHGSRLFRDQLSNYQFSRMILQYVLQRLLNATLIVM
jgi:hypothetical protein